MVFRPVAPDDTRYRGGYGIRQHEIKYSQLIIGANTRVEVEHQKRQNSKDHRKQSHAESCGWISDLTDPRFPDADSYCNCGTGAGSRRAGSIRSRLLWRTGLQMPSFCILQISVVRFRPSLAAAPFGPPITQAVASSVCRITARSESLRVVGTGETATG